MKPRALDLFCGAGGASMGLHRAGFDVVGVDIKRQPRYPFPFVQADALRPPFDLGDFDLIWASPLCQDTSIGAKRWHKEWPQQIPAVRALLAGHPMTVIENNERAPMRRDLLLDGPMFGLKTYRRRMFELSFFALAPCSGGVTGPRTNPEMVTCAGHGGHGSNAVGKWRRAMAIDWMSKDEMAQAVPPAYAEFIGRAALAHLRAAEVA
jgi:DNA (cytosine-5)-methyltransferase 1